ncbi:MAG: single-stranded-DNA-specific exonuclease RecJ [Clostridia bacterium]|nr:single-stranded-DNA-specific exonuclease RecJ [Clostridia bacterium]
MGKVWNLKEINEKEILEYKEKFKISETLASMLVSKGIKVDEVKSYLNPDISYLNDPFVLPDMKRLVDRILQAQNNQENIVIYGDYDVDGITSITVLYSFLKDIGIEAKYYLPDRLEEGYGLNKNALKLLKGEGADLIITVDCGISAFEEADYSKEIGLDLLITDHHECSDVLPEAIAVVNPKRKDSSYPCTTLAGVGVTFKVITALAMALDLPKESYLKYIDIVAVGTIADIVPLLGENRVITFNGLKALKSTKNEGLKALIKVSKIEKIDSDSVSFGLAPRINASGRMNDATIAVKLLLSNSPIEAYNLACTLDKQNKERQEVERKIFEEAVTLINEKGLDKKRSIVLAKSNWHQGVIGIVASKLTEMYLKPVVLLAIDGENAKGSARIPQGLSLYEAISNCTEFLISFGGHELAAGLSLETKNIEQFADKFESVIYEMKPDEFVKVVDIDILLDTKKIDFDLIKDVAKLAPFGQKNKMPVFLCKDLKVTSICTLKDNKHLKLCLQDKNICQEAIFFGAGSRRDELVIGDKIDIACTLSVNAFMGNIKIQFMLLDFKKSI